MTDFHKTIRQLILLATVLVACVVGSTALLLSHALGILPLGKGRLVIAGRSVAEQPSPPPLPPSEAVWQAPDPASIPATAAGELIRYGRELIAHTAVYLGPQGKVRQISNGMNCQNCHLQAGTLAFGNNFGAVASTYPRFRHRSGSVEGFEKRINDCIERSLNGQPLDEDSREMQALVAYLQWVGKDVAKDEKPKGSGLLPLPYLDRPADPVKGQQVYASYCARCHGSEGEGVMADSGLEYVYPPVYGKNSYNTGAGLYRLSRFAAFVKANMPYGTTYENPFLTDEEAWDVAAYINSMPRPEKDFAMDWPDISKKPIDHPFGPYADTFSEQQHKYGPFDPIIATSK